MNKVSLVGRLTKDIELRYTNTNISVASFILAVNRTFKNKDGVYDADFINCIAYKGSADYLSKYASKGSQVALSGSIQTRNYDNQKGEKVYVTEVIVDNVELIGSKKENQEGQAPTEERQEPQQESDPYKDFGEEVHLTDDDLPF